MEHGAARPGADLPDHARFPTSQYYYIIVESNRRKSMGANQTGNLGPGYRT